MPGVDVAARGWGWRHAARRRAAVDGLDLDLAAGERVLLLGPSGAGKSTLLAGLAGVLGGAEEGDETGELLVGGRPAREARGLAGLVLQDPQANTIMPRLGDDVAFGCENLRVPPDEIWPRVRAALDEVGLRLPLDRSTAALSGGERQRLALAGVLAMRPGLLLLDEPTANLDPEGVVEVRDAVARVCERTGATLVVVEHRVDTWLPIIDRVIVLEPGSGVRAEGAPEALLAREGDRLAGEGVWVPGHPVELARTSASGVAAGDSASGSASDSPGDVAGDSAPEVLLAARDLVIGRGGVPVQAPRSLDIPAGTSTVVTGPNGAGKSTLALTLAGLLPPVAGELAAAEGFAPRRGASPHRWRSRELLSRIGMVFQQPEHQFVASTVRAELEVGPRAARRPDAEIAARVEELLAALRLDRLAAANPFTLSGGEQRRLSVATALATSPRMLVLDEPTFGQDRLTWLELARLLDALVRDGAAIVSITHDLDLVRVLGDRRLHLARTATG